MANCATARTLAGIPFDCNSNRPGVEEIYLFNHGDVTLTPATPYDATGVPTAGSGAKVFKYELPKNTASLSSPMTFSDDGQVTYTNTIVMQFNRLEAAKHAEISAIAYGYIDAIVKDKNGKYWFVGYDEYLAPTDGNAETGTTSSDRNGYSLTLASESAYLPFEISKSDFDTVIVPLIQ